MPRIDSRSWTSLRAYLGRKGEPVWLTKEYCLELFDGSDGLRAYTLSLHRGGRSWPETMDLEWGFFNDQTQGQTASVHGRSSFRTRFVEPQRLLEMICEVTGSGLKEITTSVKGPRANPARRFAVWALRKHTILKNREIAGLLNMTYNQVSNVLSRSRGGVEPVAKWIDALSTLCDK